jgi:hypothetical protein
MVIEVVSQVPTTPFVTAAVPPFVNVTPFVLQPEDGFTPSTHSSRKSVRLGPAAVPTIEICVPGLNSAAVTGTRGANGFVIETYFTVNSI